MFQAQYLLSRLFRMCETLLHSLEAALAYLRTAVRLFPNSRLQVKLCLLFQCFPVGCFFLFFVSFFCALESLWFIKMGCDEVPRADMVSQRGVTIVSDMRGLLPFLVEYPPEHRHTHTHTPPPSAVCLFQETMTQGSP